MKVDRIIERGEPNRMDAAISLMQQFDSEPSHAMQVAKLALQLFDELAFFHGLGRMQRELLEASAYLHDIGWSRGAKAHHKSSMQMILGHPLPGWSREEILIIANVARYHTKAIPKSSHEMFAALSEANQRIVRKLAAILRVADGLDRSHEGIVQGLQCRMEDGQFKLTLFCRGRLGAEQYAFERKRDLFEKVFATSIVIAQTKGPILKQ